MLTDLMPFRRSGYISIGLSQHHSRPGGSGPRPVRPAALYITNISVSYISPKYQCRIYHQYISVVYIIIYQGIRAQSTQEAVGARHDANAQGRGREARLRVAPSPAVSVGRHRRARLAGSPAGGRQKEGTRRRSRRHGRLAASRPSQHRRAAQGTICGTVGKSGMIGNDNREQIRMPGREPSVVEKREDSGSAPELPARPRPGAESRGPSEARHTSSGSDSERAARLGDPGSAALKLAAGRSESPHHCRGGSDVGMALAI